MYRAQDPLVALLAREQKRAIACLIENTSDRSALTEARRTVAALTDAETEVLFPAFSRVQLRLEQQHLLQDLRGARAEQLTAFDALAQKRHPRLRKLAAIRLSEVITNYAERLGTELVTVLASQLARPLYRAIVQAFVSRYSTTTDR